MSVRKQTMVKIKFEGRNLPAMDFLGKSDPYLVLSRPARLNYGYQKIRRTETLWKNLNPAWKVLYIPTIELCDNNWDMKLQIDVYDEDRGKTDDYIGSTNLSVTNLFALAQSKESVPLHRKGKEKGFLIISTCQMHEPQDMLGRLNSDGSVSTYPQELSGHRISLLRDDHHRSQSYPELRRPDTRASQTPNNRQTGSRGTQSLYQPKAAARANPHLHPQEALGAPNRVSNPDPAMYTLSYPPDRRPSSSYM